MTHALETAIQAVRALSSRDKLEILHFITQDLQQGYILAEENTAFWSSEHISTLIIDQNTPIITDVSTLNGDFWPEDESADDINTYIVQQRKETQEY